jgi:3-isopropylmalate/(R)-2-methylmalate dehydratase small subunit
MRSLKQVTSRITLLAQDNINTDQIIPARFLTRTSCSDWSDGLFADWKRQPNFPLKDSTPRDSSILLAGSNFGCGSSREHAVWALRDAGFRVIIAPSFADIFFENAVKNGVLPAVVTEDAHSQLLHIVSDYHDKEWTIDLAAESIRSENEVCSFSIDPFAKHCLLRGLDELEFLLEYEIAINDFEVRANLR